MSNDPTLVLGATGNTGRRVAVRLRPGNTPVRAANFAQNFDGHPFRVPPAAGELALPAGTVPEPFTDVEDVADVAAAVLSEPGGHAGRVHEPTGWRGLTWAEAVELMCGPSGTSCCGPRLRKPGSAEYGGPWPDALDSGRRSSARRPAHPHH